MRFATASAGCCPWWRSGRFGVSGGTVGGGSGCAQQGHLGRDLTGFRALQSPANPWHGTVPWEWQVGHPPARDVRDTPVRVTGQPGHEDGALWRAGLGGRGSVVSPGRLVRSRRDCKRSLCCLGLRNARPASGGGGEEVRQSQASWRPHSSARRRILGSYSGWLATSLAPGLRAAEGAQAAREPSASCPCSHHCLWGQCQVCPIQQPCLPCRVVGSLCTPSAPPEAWWPTQCGPCGTSNPCSLASGAAASASCPVWHVLSHYSLVSHATHPMLCTPRQAPLTVHPWLCTHTVRCLLPWAGPAPRHHQVCSTPGAPLCSRASGSCRAAIHRQGSPAPAAR